MLHGPSEFGGISFQHISAIQQFSNISLAATSGCVSLCVPSLILSVVEIHPAIAIHVFQLTVYEGWKKFAIQVQSFAVETSKPDIW
jgi:hypothetical protein